MMTHRRIKALASAFLLVLVCALAACASEPEQKDRQLRKAARTKPSVEVKEPTPEELANSPCGNPDWAQLPAGAEGKVPAAKPAHQQDKQQDAQPDGQPDQQPAPAGEAGEDVDAAKGSQEQSSSSRLYHDDQPCS